MNKKTRKRRSALTPTQQNRLQQITENEKISQFLMPDAPIRRQNKSSDHVQDAQMPLVPDESMPGTSHSNEAVTFDDEEASAEYERTISHSSGSDMEEDECDPEMGDAIISPSIRDRQAHIFPADAENHLPADVCSFLTENDTADDLALRNLADTEMLSFNWVHDFNVFKGRRESFTGASGPTISKEQNSSPLSTFEQIWDDDIIELIVTETNRYANSIKSSSAAGSRIQSWQNIGRADIWLFFAITMLQSIVDIAAEKEYWYPAVPNLAPVLFKQVMAFKKFQLLKKCLHFADNTNISKSSTKLAKIAPIIDHLNKKFCSLYLPEQDICVNESLLLWKGKCSFSQLISNKVEKVGIKSYELCEARTGYLWQMLVCADKGSNFQQLETGEECQRLHDPEDAPSQIVYKLVRPLLNRGHTLVMDNFYNSPLLSRSLKAQKTDTMGTLRLNREFVPDGLKSFTKANMRKGEVAFSLTEDLSLIVWRDSNLIAMLSTYHKVEVGGKVMNGYYKYQPQVVLDYNVSMGGVDKKDQLLAGFNLERCRNATWYKKLFCRLLNVSIHNSFIIHSHSNRMKYRDFRVSLIHQIIRKYKGLFPAELPAQVNVDVVTTRQCDKRPKVVGGHYPERGESSKARCKWCAKSKVVSRTAWRCDTCKITLCINYCFKQYHTS